MKKIFILFGLLVSTFLISKAQITDPNGGNNGGFTPSSGSSQAQTMEVSNAIQKFRMSEFMVRFSDFKNQMETDARDFIARQNSYSIKDVRRVQMAYDKTAAKFNQIMLEVKQDFMDRDKLKAINKFPDMYTNGLKGKIDGLEDFYKANFQQTLSDVTEQDGSALLLVLVDLIKAAGELSNHFKNMKYEKQFMNDQYIQENLVKPYRLPSWSELSSTTNIKTDVKLHPSRDPNSGMNNGGNNNGGFNNGGTNNGGNNSGGTNNGGNTGGDINNNNGGNGNGDNNGGNNGGDVNNGGNGDGGSKRPPVTGEDSQHERGEVIPDANSGGIGVEGQSTLKKQNSPNTIKQKPGVNRPNTEGVKKPAKPNNTSN
ncbi:MAG: hypothetical protein JNL70_23260 [Saprospiraceae bacterium]|nr:hypothetical protein [Saprospiraceae bacterium]